MELFLCCVSCSLLKVVLVYLQMSNNKSSPRRRSARRYDEDYEYYVPVRHYRAKDGDDSEIQEGQEVKRKRGRPPGCSRFSSLT